MYRGSRIKSKQRCKPAQGGKLLGDGNRRYNLHYVHMVQTYPGEGAERGNQNGALYSERENAASKWPRYAAMETAPRFLTGREL